jgi:hypothetical protein
LCRKGRFANAWSRLFTVKFGVLIVIIFACEQVNYESSNFSQEFMNAVIVFFNLEEEIS